MFKIIITAYCLVGLFYNLILVPYKNIEIYKQNQFVLDRYRKMDEVLDLIIKRLEEDDHCED